MAEPIAIPSKSNPPNRGTSSVLYEIDRTVFGGSSIVVSTARSRSRRNEGGASAAATHLFRSGSIAAYCEFLSRAEADRIGVADELAGKVQKKIGQVEKVIEK
jgi:hypothetical protein